MICCKCVYYYHHGLGFNKFLCIWEGVMAVKNVDSGDLFQLILVGRLAERLADKFFGASYKKARVKEVEEW